MQVDRSESAGAVEVTGSVLLGVSKQRPPHSVEGKDFNVKGSFWQSPARAASFHPEHSTKHAVDSGSRDINICSLNMNHSRDYPWPMRSKEFTRHRSLIFVALPCMFLKFLECTQGGKLLDKDTINIRINKYMQTSGTLIKHQSFITREGGGVAGGHQRAFLFKKNVPCFLYDKVLVIKESL